MQQKSGLEADLQGRFFPTEWLGWQGSNLRMRESKSRALPLGYTPMRAPAAIRKKWGE